MEMDSSSFFPWDRLPLNLQETILGLLPISTLLRCAAVSPSLRSVVRSPSFLSSSRNPHFLFSRPNSPTGPAYDPVSDRWTSLPIPTDNATSVCISDGPLLLQLSCSPDLVLSQPFAPRSCNSIQRIPNPATLSPMALISHDSPKHFKTVALRSTDRTRWEVYDSRTREWETKGEFGGSLPVRTSVFSGLLYCLACGAGNTGQRLFTYDPAGGSESELGHVSMPSAVRALYFLVFNGRLFLVGCEVDSGGGKIAGIGMWELDRARMEWRAYCRMPEDVFSKFAEGGLVHLQISDGKGMICFASYKRIAGVYVLMCDLSEKRWWWPRACEGMNQGKVYCAVHAVEPDIDVLRSV